MDMLIGIAPLGVDLFVYALLAFIAFAAKRWFGISIEGRRAAMLQSALRNAAEIAFDRLPGIAREDLRQSRLVLVQQAREYLRQSIPDTLAALKLDDHSPGSEGKLELLLTPHLREVERMVATGIFRRDSFAPMNAFPAAPPDPRAAAPSDSEPRLLADRAPRRAPV